MDSGNSCSLNSSSCGDDQDQYDLSRNTNDSSISAFLNSSSNTHQVNNNSNIFSNSNQQPPPPLHPHMSHDNNHQQSSINFDHLSNYLNPFSSSRSSPQTPNSLLNLDMVWPKNIITSSEPNKSTNNNNIIGSSSSTLQHNQYMGGNIHFSNPLVQPSLGDGSARVSSDNHQQKATRNPKKRTRASRRAPTTVLTTDTSNFRAMVQEFTGIPAAPFSASTSVFPRSQFDLFNTSSTGNGKQSGLSAPPPYLLRPFPHKVIHQLSPSSTSINTTGSNNSDHHSNEPQNLLNIQYLTFQSLLNPSHHQQSNVPMLFAHHDKSKVLLSSSSNDNSQLRMAAMEEFNMNANTTATTTTTSHGILGGTLSNIVDASNDMTLGINSGSHHYVNENNDHLGSSCSGNFNYSERVSGSNSSSNCKMNFTGSSTASDFHAHNVGFDNAGDGFNKR